VFPFFSSPYPMTDEMYAGSVAATRILARVPRSVDFCAGALGSQSPFLRHKLLDPGDSGIRYCSPTLSDFHQEGVEATSRCCP
jgi:hypothetical protein